MNWIIMKKDKDTGVEAVACADLFDTQGNAMDKLRIMKRKGPDLYLYVTLARYAK